MPWQLIYTSAPRGLTPGQSGYCTVARSQNLREGLIPRLEKLSYYTPELNRDPVICAYRILELRGARYHVLSRIVDSGLDFTRRRKFIAHHLVFESSEIESAPSPARVFLKWPSWLQHWEGEPQWLEQTSLAPLPSSESTSSAWRKLTGNENDALALHADWITGDEEERAAFLECLDETLVRRREGLEQPGAHWDWSFTNCFQPGDDPADFRVKAVWPKTPGYEIARQQGADLNRLRDLRASIDPSQAPMEPAIDLVQQPPTTQALSGSQKTRSFLWPALAGFAAILAFAAVFLFGPQNKTPESSGSSIASAKPLAVAEPSVLPTLQSQLDAVFPISPTWIAVIASEERPLGPIPPLENLMKLLRDSEIFGKDIAASIQGNLRSRASSAVVDAHPGDNILKFTAAPDIELQLKIVSGIAPSVQSSHGRPFILDISTPTRLRIIGISETAPMLLSSRFLLIDARALTCALDPNLEKRLRAAVLPPGSQLALRPLILSTNGTTFRDPIAALESDFALNPATAIDLASLRSHVDHVITDKETRQLVLEAERSRLAVEQKKLITQPKTPEELKRHDRIAALDLALPKLSLEVKTLRAKAALLPTDLSKIEHFSVLLCQSNVNTELIRFVDEPNLSAAP